MAGAAGGPGKTSSLSGLATFPEGGPLCLVKGGPGCAGQPAGAAAGEIVGTHGPRKTMVKPHRCVPRTATFSTEREVGALWRERCDGSTQARYANSCLIHGVDFSPSRIPDFFEILC